ncbi:putative GPI anchored protein [Aspergillus chevalieri]|uniref:GPI anchored protein n=1 Tax=Aspergillus chevalieri TaxID=182096 RepID=A0A7R7VEK7_ASPCH|nr:uncharacterized protein ACHE_10680S [Aspergillus chevalieri]BCR83278.1 hypothetical protein ACHE_10680S [Aspergillus chevalieri]
MKGFSAGIPIAILAALGQVQAQAQVQDVAKRQFGSPFEHHIEHGLEDVFDHPPHPHGGPHGGPPGGPHGGPHGGPGPAAHPPMAHAARAFRPGEDAPSIDSDPFFSEGLNEGRPADHGPSAVPTCSTRTEHVVHTITKTVTPEHEHKHTPTSHAIGLDPAAHVPQSSSSSSVHAPVTTPAVAHVAHSSSTVQAPHTSSAAHIDNVPHTSSAVHIVNAPHTSSAHSALIPASTQAPTSTAAHGPVATSTSTVHAPMSYNVIPVHVPSSSHSSIKLHASNTPSSSSAYPSGADGTRFHGTYGTPGAGVSFTGAGAHLVPNTGIVTAVCGLLGLLASTL